MSCTNAKRSRTCAHHLSRLPVVEEVRLRRIVGLYRTGLYVRADAYIEGRSPVWISWAALYSFWALALLSIGGVFALRAAQGSGVSLARDGRGGDRHRRDHLREHTLSHHRRAGTRGDGCGSRSTRRSTPFLLGDPRVVRYMQAGQADAVPDVREEPARCHLGVDRRDQLLARSARSAPASRPATFGSVLGPPNRAVYQEKSICLRCPAWTPGNRGGAAPRAARPSRRCRRRTRACPRRKPARRSIRG